MTATPLQLQVPPPAPRSKAAAPNRRVDAAPEAAAAEPFAKSLSRRLDPRNDNAASAQSKPASADDAPATKAVSEKSADPEARPKNAEIRPDAATAPDGRKEAEAGEEPAAEAGGEAEGDERSRSEVEPKPASNATAETPRPRHTAPALPVYAELKAEPAGPVAGETPGEAANAESGTLAASVTTGCTSAASEQAALESTGGQTQASPAKPEPAAPGPTDAAPTRPVEPSSQRADGTERGRESAGTQPDAPGAEAVAKTASEPSREPPAAAPIHKASEASQPAGNTADSAATARGPERNSDARTALEQLVSRGLSAALQQRGGSLTMRLAPESLGAMRIQMEMQPGVVAVNLEVATPEAQRLLSQSIESLRASLEAKGLAVEKLGVSLAPPSSQGPIGTQAHAGGGGAGWNSGGTPDQPRGQDAQSRFANHDAGDGRSRSWLGGDQRNDNGSGGAGRHAHQGAAQGIDEREFADLWSRLRLGVDATA